MQGGSCWRRGCGARDCGCGFSQFAFLVGRRCGYVVGFFGDPRCARRRFRVDRRFATKFGERCGLKDFDLGQVLNVNLADPALIPVDDGQVINVMLFENFQYIDSELVMVDRDRIGGHEPMNGTI